MIFLRVSLHAAYMTTATKRRFSDGVPSPAHFGTRLAMVRQANGWNITQAARACGLPEATWRTWERGSLPQQYHEVCKAISDATGLPLVWLLTGQEIGFGDSGSPDQNLKILLSRVARPAAAFAS